MSTLEVKALAVQLSSLVDTLEKRIDHAVRQSLQATQALDHQCRQSLETTGSLVQQALAQLRDGADQAITEGVRDAMQELDQAMRDGANRVEQATTQLDQRMQHMRRINTSHAWKAFVASAVGSLAVMAVAVYVARQAHTEVKRADWIQQINAVIDAGQLAPCPEGGLCVKVGSKWVRLHGK